MRQLLTAAKRVVAATLFYSGLLPLYARWKLRNRAVVLTYHRVLPQEMQQRSFCSPSIVVTPESFERHLRMLRRVLRPVSLPEFERVARGEASFGPRTCLVTFDDGWYDNLQFALPLLERVAVPATVFVATGFVGKHGGFWQERLAAGVDRMCRSPEQHRARLGTLGLDALPAMPDGVRRVAIRDFVTRQKSRSRVEIEQLLREVDAHSDSGFPDGAASTQDRFMTWDELARLARSQRVTLASHGVSHTPFTKLSAEDVCDELEASRQALEERLGVRTTAIAYPNGEFDSRVAEAAERSGYRVGFTTERGFAGDRAQAMTIRRVNVHDGAAPTAAMLLARIVGWF